MHARIDQLLSIRDAGPVAAHMAQHVAQCAMCAAELRRLSLVREQLQMLPQLDAPFSAWEQIRFRTARCDDSNRRRRFGAIAAAAGIAVLAILIGLASREDGTPSTPGLNAQSPSTGAATPGAADETSRVADLVAQSQHLEQLLQTLPQRPRIERVSTTATIDTIEHRIQWLDFRLSYAPDSDLNEEQAQRLWRERVELMDSLVKVRYAEAERLSF